MVYKFDPVKKVVCIALAVGFILTCNALAADFQIIKIGTIKTGAFGEGAAEISAYDAESRKVFVTNAETNSIDIISIADPYDPELIGSIPCNGYGGGVNSVVVKKGLVAIAVEGFDKQENGSVVFFDRDGNFLNQVTAGALPDMLTFTKNGKKVLVANEGEPNGDYTVDPEGSVTIIDLKKGVHSATAKQVTFEKFNKFKDDLIEDGVRIFGPNASVAQDLEPEYIAIGPYGKFAYVALQENNAIAVINIKHARCVRIYSLGLKDHSLAGNALDASNKDDMINMGAAPMKRVKSAANRGVRH